jgi:PAS domain S-box-containing protein
MRAISHPALRIAICVAAVVAIAAVYTYPLPASATTAALTLLIAVLVGSGWGLWYAVFLSVLSTLVYGYLFLPPVGVFKLTDPQNWHALVAFLIAGITVSSWSERARKEALKAEQRGTEVARSRQRFSDLVNSVDGIVWEADAETFAYSFISEQAERILGYPVPRWLTDATFWRDHLHPDDRDGALRFRQTATAERRSGDVAYRMIAADGRVVWLRDFMTVVIEQDRVAQLRGVMVVTRQAEEALRERANLLNLVHDTIFVRGIDSTITYWNRGAEELYGWTAEEVAGEVTHELLKTVFPIPLEQIEAEVLSTGRWEGELVHTKKDGTRVVVASRWSVRRDEQGAPVGFLETNNDITERKQAEEAVRQARADLAHMSRVTTMGELTASLAHELSQPIAAAVTDANTCYRWLTRGEPDVEEAREAAMRIVKDGTRAAEILARIRSFYKKSAPQRDVVDVNDIVREMLVLLRNEANRYSVSIRTELAAELPKVTVDRVQLQQVFMNLMLNGIEAMKDTAGELAIKSQRDQDGQLLISVSDTGVGLPAGHGDRIFNAFFTTKPEGTGMGLAITRSILESHGGRVWVTAGSGRGATFHFTLPSEPAAA